ncbi:hypothetical protein [Leptospira santarosai]|uniref:Uncharacterized protein n=1 Tax=Leptospira santarosai str. MOR084 TaxID=1049984 RepID=A0A0E2BDG1_9LEPT|nr:hypothetical protein [Leptospira santarosai]EKO33330.1 hypothetical protein LEP1GSC179_2640 [Leptospira santarosai str. MOR084]EMO32184.1 hypothetical protein LEP1GSC175_0572 [Leptospira santarosai str. HAI821]MDI7156650.1 hypothetical protein [Leptospira santarosai]
MEYYESIRTSLSLEEIREQIRDTLSVSNIQISECNVTLRSDEFEIELDWTPLNPMRETYENLRTKFRVLRSEREYSILEDWQKILRTFTTHVSIRMMDCYFLYSKVSLEKFCKRVGIEFDCGVFDFDYENDNEWAIAETDDFIFHLSRAYKKNTYHIWNPKECPPGCNYCIDVTVKDSADDREGYGTVWFARWEKIFRDLSCKSIVNYRKSPIH